MYIWNVRRLRRGPALRNKELGMQVQVLPRKDSAHCWLQVLRPVVVEICDRRRGARAFSYTVHEVYLGTLHVARSTRLNARAFGTCASGSRDIRSVIYGVAVGMEPRRDEELWTATDGQKTS